MTDWKYYSMLS